MIRAAELISDTTAFATPVLETLPRLLNSDKRMPAGSNRRAFVVSEGVALAFGTLYWA
jgi:hypothetical protein